jgi:hypothetical protein
MADKVKVKMLRAVGGFAEGAERELSASDAKRLEARGVVEVTKAKADAPAENKAAPENVGALENKAAPRKTRKRRA